MAGRKQHHIPQFVLRGFSDPGSGRYPQVRVVTPTGNFICATQGVAAEREFYSKLDEGKDSLDNPITEQENEYSEIHRSLINSSNHEEVDAVNVARLLTHLTVRSGHIRDSLSILGQHAAQKAMDLASDPVHVARHIGLDAGEPSVAFRAMLDELYNDNRDKVRKLKMSRHEFRKFAFDMVRANFTEWMEKSDFPLIALAIIQNMDEIAGDGHRKALLGSIEPEDRVQALQLLKWKSVHSPVDSFVLPDSIAIAHSDDHGAIPLSMVGNKDLKGVLFPIAPRVAICGGSYSDTYILDHLIPHFPDHAAFCSWNFMAAPPSFEFSNSINGKIGSAVAKFIAGIIDAAVLKEIGGNLSAD